MTLFFDTSIWYAAADSSDRSNARAKAVFKSGGQLVTSDHILVETWTLLHHRVQRNAAERFWDGLRTGGAIGDQHLLHLGKFGGVWIVRASEYLQYADEEPGIPR
jgi:hypothetical protein